MKFIGTWLFMATLVVGFWYLLRRNEPRDDDE